MEFITTYSIFNSKSHILWDLFYFEIASIILIPSIKNTLSLATCSFKFWGVSAMGSIIVVTFLMALHLNSIVIPT